MNYYTSDLHVDHKNIIKICNRPFPSVEEMEAELVKRWNAKVTPIDHVYVLGDIMFRPQKFNEFIGKLNGSIHYIAGNHDADVWRKNKSNPTSHVYFHPPIHEIHDRIGSQEYKVILCHYPIHEWNGMFNGAIHLHGHCHGNIGVSFKERAYDVGVDLWDFAPISLEEIFTKTNQ